MQLSNAELFTHNGPQGASGSGVVMEDMLGERTLGGEEFWGHWGGESGTMRSSRRNWQEGYRIDTEHLDPDDLRPLF